MFDVLRFSTSMDSRYCATCVHHTCLSCKADAPLGMHARRRRCTHVVKHLPILGLVFRRLHISFCLNWNLL